MQSQCHKLTRYTDRLRVLVKFISKSLLDISLSSEYLENYKTWVLVSNFLTVLNTGKRLFCFYVDVSFSFFVIKQECFIHSICYSYNTVIIQTFLLRLQIYFYLHFFPLETKLWNKLEINRKDNYKETREMWL